MGGTGEYTTSYVVGMITTRCSVREAVADSRPKPVVSPSARLEFDRVDDADDD
jgi:hypothetical protein